MQFDYLSFMLLLGLGVAVAGYFVRFDKRSNFVFLFSSTIWLLAGLFAIASPITYESGATIDTSVTPNVVTYLYTAIPVYQSTGIALTIALIGLGGLIFAMFGVIRGAEGTPDSE